MNSTACIILAFLICGFLAVAGCTTIPAAPPVTTPAPSVTLASLAIDRNDLPQGYVLTMSREKNAIEMGSFAENLGWQGGYVVEYSMDVASDGSRNVILHSLASYPDRSLPGIIEYINRTDRSCSTMGYFDIAVSDLGENSRAFIGYIPNQGTTPGVGSTTADTSPAPAAITGRESPRSTCREKFVEIIFFKGTILEVIRMSGPVLDDKEAIGIAQKAYVKIP